MRNWDDMRVFLAVARAGRIAPAARLLGIDVTTVTRRLARLKGSTGVPLFETIGGERRLSEAGQTLLLHAETIEAAMIAASEGDGGRTGVAGHVRLSLAEGLSTHVIAPRVADFQAAYPNIRLDLITASGFLNPSKREADVAAMLARPRGAQLRTARLLDYRLRLYATRAYIDGHGEPREAAALAEHVLVGYVPEHIHAVELDYLSEIHDGLTARLRSTSINVQHAMIRSGAAVGILPDFIAATDPALVPVDAGGVALTRTFWLVTHEDTHGTPRIEAVSEWLRASVRGIS
ncbi:MAG: LysR family transcriptional regulator [Pseudomonadota bacterium]|nr:LysR family transcriptional regulator [Pseudomonadota bacterium]